MSCALNRPKKQSARSIDAGRHFGFLTIPSRARRTCLFEGTMTESNLENELIPFLRRRDYRLVRELGHGACGKTVLLHDAQIDDHFVCKKYAPYTEGRRIE